LSHECEEIYLPFEDEIICKFPSIRKESSLIRELNETESGESEIYYSVITFSNNFWYRFVDIPEICVSVLEATTRPTLICDASNFPSGSDRKEI